jgi:hypothetical protein
MKGAILIYGGSLKDRVAKSKEFMQDISPANILEVEVPSDKKSIGIEQVRQAVIFIGKKPFLEGNKVIIVPNADKLTTEAQNAFLKVLEEPPEYALIILCAKTQEALLPTVISRCQRVSVHGEEGRAGDSGEKSELEKVKKMSVDEKFTWSQETAKEEKEDIVEMLEKWIYEERECLSKNSNAAHNINHMLQVKKDLESTNVNTRLALDFLLFHLL